MITSTSISFEPPFHQMCVTRQAILTTLTNITYYLFLADYDLTQLPNIITLEGRRYSYRGVSDGQSHYREVEPISNRIKNIQLDENGRHPKAHLISNERANTHDAEILEALKSRYETTPSASSHNSPYRD